MATLKKRTTFFETEAGIRIMEELRVIAGDAAYNTGASYSSDSELYPNNQIPFIDKHVNYINAHPNLDATIYVNNLRLMTRVRAVRSHV